MRPQNTCITMLMLFILASSCSKEYESITEPKVSNQEISNVSSNNLETVNGLCVYNGGVDVVTEKLDYAGLKLVRTPFVLSEKTQSDVVDKYLQAGYNVQINLNWQQPSSGPVPFPTELDSVKSRAEQFFAYYATWKDQIPLVAVENEWDNTHYHTGSIDDYINELRVITEIGHKYGFKIADAGLSGTSYRRWIYSRLDEEMAKQWKQWYWVGEKRGNFSVLIETVNHYAEAIQSIPIDYLNVHWYNLDTCRNTFAMAGDIYKTACNKPNLICNEFGVKLDSDQLFEETVQELKGSIYFGIAYSGTGEGDGKKAVALSDAMLTSLNSSRN